MVSSKVELLRRMVSLWGPVACSKKARAVSRVKAEAGWLLILRISSPSRMPAMEAGVPPMTMKALRPVKSMPEAPRMRPAWSNS